MKCIAIVVLLAPLALTTACGGGGGGAASVAGPATQEPTAPADKPLVDYKTPLMAAAAGQYTGVCKKIENDQPIDAMLKIDKDALVTLSTGGSALVTGSRATVGWSRDQSTGGFAFSLMPDQLADYSTGVQFDMAVNGTSMKALVDGNGLICEKVTGPAAMLGKSSYQVAAQFLDAKKTALKCVDVLTHKDYGLQSYEIQDGQVQLFGETFSLLGPILEESVFVRGLPPGIAASATLTYLVTLADGRKFGLSHDAYGDLLSLQYSRDPGHRAVCGLAK